MKRASAALLGFCLLALGAMASPAPAFGAEEGVAAGEHAAAAAEHEGGEGGEHETSIDGKKLALQFLNFGVLLFILIKFGGGAVNKALAARHTQLKADLAAAAEARAEAEARLKKQEQRMANLEKEIATIRAGIALEAEAEKARLIAAAEERAKRLKDETAFIIEQQVKEGEATLRREASNAAVTIAEQLLKQQMNAGDQQRFIDGFIDDVAAEKPAAPGTVS